MTAPRVVIPPARLWLALLLLPLAAVAAALVSQHVFGMQPCAWCVLQRLLFVAVAAVAAVALLGLRWRSQRLGPLNAVLGLLALALALGGMAAALWQHFVAASSSSCALTLADRIVGGLGLDALAPEVFAAYASCADAAVQLLGLPYEFFSLALFAALAALAGLALVKPRPRAGA